MTNQSRLILNGGASGLAVYALCFCLLGCGFFAQAQVDHFEISPIASPQHVSGFFPSLAPFSVTVTARGTNGNIVPFNGEAALTGVLNGTPDYTFNFEEGNLNLWTRLNPFSSYAVTSLDVDGDGHDSLALDMRLNYGTGYGISRRVFLQGGVPYTMAIASAFGTDQDVFYGGPYVRWSLRVETTTVAEYQLGLGYMFANLTQRVGLSGAYVPPTNGFYSISFVFECPFAETRMHVYADNFRVGYASLGPASVILANGQGTVGITADRPVTNILLRATDAQLHTGDSNPFDILPMANLNLFTFVEGTPRAGEDIIFHDVVYNFGPSTATDVRVTNIPPAGLSIIAAVPSQGSCTNIGGILYCNLGAIPGNNTYQELVITARTSTPGSYTNLASVGANEYDPDSYYSTSERVGVISVAQPFVEAPAVSASEGAGVLRFALNLRGPSTERLVVSYATSNLTALAGLDYTASTGQVEFAPGETNKEVLVPILNDVLNEDDETFALYFSDATQDGMAVGTIVDDDPLPALSISDVSGLEGGYGTNDFIFALSLSQPSGRDVSVRFATADGTAIAGSDYLGRAGVVTFPAGTTNAWLSVSVRGNTVNEADEFFFVNLSQPVNLTLARAQAIATILNDDAVPGQFEHFGWSTIGSPQVVNRPIFLQVTARDAFDNFVPGFNGPVPLAISRRTASATNVIPPALSLSFTNGVASLILVLTNAYSNVVCRLDDGLDHVAESNPFSVMNALPMTLTLPPAATEGDGTLAGQGRVTFTYADDRDALIALQSFDTTEVQVPPNVLVPAGQTSAVFNVTIIDDTDYDGSRTVMVGATAPDHTTATAQMVVHDNEPGALALTLPASLQEKGSASQGRVEMNVVATEPVQVSLTSSDTTELKVPGFVTIPAGQSAAVFNLQVVDDNLIDGPQPVTVTAHVQNWIDGTASTVVEDNESTNISFEPFFQGPFTEGAGTITNGLRVRLGGVAVSNVTLSLLSSDTTELLVPSSVTIAAGQSSTNFSITIVDDLETDGPQTVMVTASAPGFGSGSLALTVRDNDVHHFDFAPFSNGNRTSTVPFSVSISAKDISGAALFSFAGPVGLSATGDLGFVALQPTNTTAFTRGSWIGLVTITNGANTNVRVIADDGLGHTGQSSPFTVYAPPAQQTRILTAKISGADVQLEFSTVNGRHYRIEAAPTLVSSSWVVVVADVLGTGSPLPVVIPGGAQALDHFYRAALQP